MRQNVNVIMHGLLTMIEHNNSILPTIRLSLNLDAWHPIHSVHIYIIDIAIYMLLSDKYIMAHTQMYLYNLSYILYS